MSTYILIEAMRKSRQQLDVGNKRCLRLRHLSTEEVIGHQDFEDDNCNEPTVYAQSSRLPATKASGERLGPGSGIL